MNVGALLFNGSKTFVKGARGPFSLTFNINKPFYTISKFIINTGIGKNDNSKANLLCNIYNADQTLSFDFETLKLSNMTEIEAVPKPFASNKLLAKSSFIFKCFGAENPISISTTEKQTVEWKTTGGHSI